MPSFFTLLAVFFFQGVLHGFGPDHLMAVSSLSVMGRRGRTVGVAVRFGAGHSLVLVAGAVLAAVGFWAVSPAVEQTGERLAGAALAALGVVTLLQLVGDRVYVHKHTHGHAGHTHEHNHLHFTKLHGFEHRHPHWSTLIGGLFALGGIRSLLMAPALIRSRSWSETLVLIAVFGIGIVAAMTLWGAANGKLIDRAGPRVRRALVVLVGLVSIVLGGVWIWSS